MRNLLDRYLAGSCSDAEQLLLENWLEQQQNGNNQWASMDATARAKWIAALYKDIQQTITPGVEPASLIPFYRRPVFRIAAAAAVIIAIVGVSLREWTKKPSPETAAAKLPVVSSRNDVLPGGNKAILTLANGNAIILDSASNGTLAQQDNATIVKTASGQLTYNTGNSTPTEILYNTLVTPRGGQYNLTLPDGSRVWLNSASSIHYPTAFAGKERKVTISGEAYFEVKEDASKPFIVSISGAAGDKGEIKVLGTHFNINAYDDEGTVRTTLLEGAVQVEKGETSTILKPLQQAQLTGTGNLSVVDGADIDEVIAWKNGKTLCKNMGLEDIMRQVARWYDVDVVYENKIEDPYTVNISRDVPVSSLFKFLEASGGVHFKIEGKKITVLK